MLIFCGTNLIVGILWRESYRGILWHESYCRYSVARVLLASQPASQPARQLASQPASQQRKLRGARLDKYWLLLLRASPRNVSCRKQLENISGELQKNVLGGTLNIDLGTNGICESNGIGFGIGMFIGTGSGTRYLRWNSLSSTLRPRLEMLKYHLLD